MNETESIMRSHYSLFYLYDGEQPVRFQEARVFDSTVWTAGGAVMTWGEEARSDCASELEAQAAYAAHCQAALADGYVLAQARAIDPAVFEFGLLQNLVRDGARRAFNAARTAHPTQHLNAFALLSDDSAMTIGPVANSREALAASEYGEEMLWNPGEWCFGDGGAYLDSAYRMLLQAHRGLPFELDFATFRRGVFEACIAALEELDSEGFFGVGEQRDDCVLLFEVTDSEAVEGAMARLNPPAVVARFDTWMSSWAD